MRTLRSSIAVMALSCLVAPGIAQDRPITLEDLQRALQNSERAEAEDDTPAASEAPNEASGLPVVETPEPAAITLDDLRRALSGEPAETFDTTVAEVSEVAAQPVEPEVTTPVEAYPTDMSKWVCQISAFDRATPAAADPEEAGKLSIYFASADYTLNRSGVISIARNSDLLRDMVETGDGIAVSGYTDFAGDPTANIILSLQRAYNTKACIMDLAGIDERDIVVSGHGNFSPILEPSEPSAAGNRRADIISLAEHRRRFEESFAALNE